MSKELHELTQNGIIFDMKPDAIPYNYRISYKVSLLCMILKMCGGRRGCSLVKIHILFSVLENDKELGDLRKFIHQHGKMDLCVHFNPSVNRALEYSMAYKLVTQQVNGRYKLLPKGRLLVDKIMRDYCLLMEEKNVLDDISINLTEEMISEMHERWQILNDED
ncbi:hypothetical protein SAMN02745229_00198 [Butyrivibrio fibrisolvens DSM 3071]|uniref:Uncharacterized protein n=1 Tax=Butyrivibrio fibrisolvens DSM 3071 TaxID=1121131 RepID=A0A1M5Q5E1_BUTFI|nr:hypothetical protein [Butyrivibrio fibrisolvens]SHH09080.1 hypothetical protein SAMN02745229_00198 [Butyrivibrio fibrisolvens DSM 3071]